ncbi:MAG TPA: cupin domain-containing protein [Lysobacter sp.]|nr:cupin domain-containing protein [Lysobacter sp.]
MTLPDRLPTLLLLSLLPLAAVAQDKPKDSPAGAQAAMGEHTMIKAAATQWGDAPPALPKGAQAAVLAGDPGKEGVFTIRLKMPAGYRVPRHWHPTAEAVTLIEGDFTLSMGDASNAHEMSFAPGDFVNLPAHMQHEGSSKGGAVVQVQGTGPFQITYVDPKDDPRGAMDGKEGKADAGK